MTTPLLRILIVEDDPVINTVLRELLADAAIATVSAASLAEAREHLARHTIVGVVLDYGLPDGSGEDLLRELADTPYAPGVVLASAHPAAAAVAQRYGIRVIPKPLDLDAVFTAVHAFIRGEGKPTSPRA